MTRRTASESRYWTLMLGALLVLAAGPLHAATDSAGLTGSAWRLVTLPGAALLPGITVSLLLGDGAASGSDGCNRYRLPAAATDGVLRFSGQAMATQMACAPDVMQLAAAYHDALRRTDAGRVEGERLVLRDAGDTVVAVFERQDRQLHGSPWAVTGYNNGRGGVVSILAGTDLALRFETDGRLGGSAGCNRFMTRYRVDGDSIRIEPAATTRRVCPSPDGIMEQEAAFLAALARTERAEVFDDRLALRDAAGALQVQATRQPGSAVGGSPAPGTQRSDGRGEAGKADPGLDLPASFTGDLPCADCDAIRHHLDLWPDGVFHLRRTWITPPGADGDLDVDLIGRWDWDRDRNVLRLQGAESTPLYFSVEGPGRLRALDVRGRTIESDLPYDLHWNPHRWNCQSVANCATWRMPRS
jgi:heat shock protein HslJ